jgi:phosphoribosylamine--glycine ligase
MGDPECQVILPRLKSDLVRIIINTVNNKLKRTKINWKKDKSMTIVLCSKGYPGIYKKNKKITNINKLILSKNDFVYHAGTKFLDGQLLSNGGRVLNITSTGKNFINIRNKIIKFMKILNWKYGFYRKDIGWKVINK